MSETEQFLKLFFNEGETFCVSDSQFAYSSVGMDSFYKNEIELISPNPDIKPTKAPFSSMALMALNPISGPRRDKNVTAFRSFLIEMDDGTAEAQYAYIKHLKVPFSCCVWSGNKSLHFGIVLSEDLGSIETYKYVAQWLLNICSKADQAVKNPSRCIRMPEVKREKYQQTLAEIKKRVPLEELYHFLSLHKDKRPKTVQKKTKSDVKNGKIPYWVAKALKDVNSYAAHKGLGRNTTWFNIFIALSIAGMGLDEMKAATINYFEEEDDFPESEWRAAAKSASDRVKLEEL